MPVQTCTVNGRVEHSRQPYMLHAVPITYSYGDPGEHMKKYLFLIVLFLFCTRPVNAMFTPPCAGTFPTDWNELGDTIQIDIECLGTPSEGDHLNFSFPTEVTIDAGSSNDDFSFAYEGNYNNWRFTAGPNVTGDTFTLYITLHKDPDNTYQGQEIAGEWGSYLCSNGCDNLNDEYPHVYTWFIPQTGDCQAGLVSRTGGPSYDRSVYPYYYLILNNNDKKLKQVKFLQPMGVQGCYNGWAAGLNPNRCTAQSTDDYLYSGEILGVQTSLAGISSASQIQCVWEDNSTDVATQLPGGTFNPLDLVTTIATGSASLEVPVSCDSLDILCRIKQWFFGLFNYWFVYNPENTEPQIASFNNTINNKVPFAYMIPLKELNFGDSVGTAGAIPALHIEWEAEYLTESYPVVIDLPATGFQTIQPFVSFFRGFFELLLWASLIFYLAYASKRVL